MPPLGPRSLFPPRAAAGRSPRCSPHAAEARSPRSVSTRLALATRLCTLGIAAAARHPACAPRCPDLCPRAAEGHAPCRLALGAASSRSHGQRRPVGSGDGCGSGGCKRVGMVEVGSGWLVKMLGRIGLGVE
jgi:hypothetical protein